MGRLRRLLTCVLAVLVVGSASVPVPANAESLPKLTASVVDAAGPVSWPVLDLYRFDADTGWAFVDEFSGEQGGRLAVPLTGMPAGDYTVRVAEGSHHAAWYGGADGLPPTLADGNHFTLPGAGDIALGTITLVRLLAVQAHGRVRGPGGSTPAGLVVVLARDADALAAGDVLDSSRTAGDGTFTVGAAAEGSYQLQVSDPSHALLPATAEVSLSGTAPDLGTITLAANPSRVTGVARSAGGPLPGVDVTVLIWDGSAFVPYASGTSGTDGGFSVAVVPGACFTVRAGKDGYATGSAGGSLPATCPGAGTRLAASPGAANEIGDVLCVRLFTVTGSVASRSGTAIAGAVVEIYPSGSSEPADLVDSAHTDERGDFTTALPAGTYDVRYSGTDVPFTPVVVPVTISVATSLGTIRVDPQQALSGQLRSAAGPLARATATLYRQSGDDLLQSGRAVTGADGAYEFPVVSPGVHYVLRLSGHGFADAWRTGVMPTGSRELDPTSLDASPSDLGAVAGQQFPFCSATSLPAADDNASAAVSLPFPVRLFGTSSTSLYVNTNGSVSFTRPRAAFLPSQLTGATGVPMIAPLLADVDTSAPSDREVSFGASADGTTFCVQWADARQYGGDARDTFQLLLTARGGNGDVDLTLNYDRLTWDTGVAVGTPATAVAGFTDGTGVAGRYVRFAGSGAPGRLVDGGANALVAGSLGTGLEPPRPGRYVIPFRGGDTAGFGTLTGVVAGPDGSAGGLVVSACRDVGAEPRCSTTMSRSDGGFSFVALRAATYRLRVVGDQELEDDPATVLVAAGAGADAGTLRVRPVPASPSPTPEESPSPEQSPTPDESPTPNESPTPDESPSPSPSPSLPATPPVAEPPALPPSSASPPPSAPPAVVAPAKKLTKTPTPTISGTRRVGRTLKAKPGTWRPAGVKLSYQWLRTGKPITGATRSSYHLKNADRGHRIRVKVTGRKAGYTTVTKVSAATAKVKRR